MLRFSHSIRSVIVEFSFTRLVYTKEKSSLYRVSLCASGSSASHGGLYSSDTFMYSAIWMFISGQEMISLVASQRL